MSQTVKLLFSKNDQVLGEASVNISASQTSNIRSKTITTVIGSFFVVVFLVLVYMIIYTIFS